MFHSQPPPSLEDEIATLRANIHVVANALAEADDPTRHAHALARLSDALVKALRAQRDLAPDPLADWQLAVDRVFLERGMGPTDPIEAAAFERSIQARTRN